MADYYSILKKTISGLSQNTPEVRQTVYTKARTAIENQLRRMDPAPSEDAIAAQLNQLEDSISVIEIEFSHETGVTPAPDTPAAQPEPMPAAPTVPPEPAPAASIEPSPPPLPVDPSGQPQEPTPQPSEVPPAAPDLTPQPVPAPPQENEANASTMAADMLADPALAASETPPEQKKGLVRRLLPAALILLLLGGLGVAGWLYRDLIGEQIAALTGSEETQQVSENQADDAELEESTEEPVVTEEEVTEQAEDEQADSGPAETEENVTLEQSDVPVVPEQETPTSEGEEIASESELAAEPVQESEPLPPATTGEIAFLYEEGSAGSGATRADASVSWSLVELKPEASLPPEAAINGSMNVPDKGLQLGIVIKRNVDPALSASHLIELSFNVQPGFDGGGVENISRFVMKATEEARGEPLVAVPVKVSEGFFLIALDNLDQAVEVNRQLLLESEWIDIPLSYSTGKRALVTLEKGEQGMDIFRQAFADWQNR